MTQETVQAIADALAGLIHGIVPERVYEPQEAAELCGWKEGANPGRSFRDATRGRLPVVKLTAAGQRIGYHGRDLIRFIEENKAP